MSEQRKFSSNAQNKHQQQPPVLTSQPTIFQPNQQQNVYQVNRQQPINPQQNTYQMGQQQPQQNMFQTGQQQSINSQQNFQQQQVNSQQNMYQINQQQQPINSQQNFQRQQVNPQQNMYQTNQQQQPINSQQNLYQTGQRNQFLQQQFQRTGPISDKTPRHRRQMNVPPNTNFQMQQQIPFNPQQQQQLPVPQQMPFNPQEQQLQQQQLSAQPIVPIQQQPQQMPMPTQPILQAQQPGLNPMASLPTSAIFQNGQVYPTMDPQFNVQAQVASGPSGNSKKSKDLFLFSSIHNYLIE